MRNRFVLVGAALVAASLAWASGARAQTAGVRRHTATCGTIP